MATWREGNSAYLHTRDHTMLHDWFARRRARGRFQDNVTMANPESRADVRLEAFSLARLRYSFLQDSACSECSFRLMLLPSSKDRASGAVTALLSRNTTETSGQHANSVHLVSFSASPADGTAEYIVPPPPPSATGFERVVTHYPWACARCGEHPLQRRLPAAFPPLWDDVSAL